MVIKRVTIGIEIVGQAFGCAGVIYDARTGRRLASTERTYPYGDRSAARSGAEALAESKGWTIVDGEVQS